MKTLTRALSPVALFAWGALMLYFYASGRLAAYLVPAYRPGVAVAGVVMLAIAVGQLYSLRFGAGWQTASGLFADGSDELAAPNRVRVTQFLSFVMLVVPVWAAVGMSKDAYAATAMLNRGVVSDAASLPGKSAASAAPAASAVYEPPSARRDARPGGHLRPHGQRRRAVPQENGGWPHHHGGDRPAFCLRGRHDASGL